MADYPALPLWTDAYLADTTHLSHAEHGRYLLMLIHLWRMPNKRFPNDDGWLARKFCCSEEDIRELFRPLILEFFNSTGNWLYQKRILKEFERVQAVCKRASDRRKSRETNETNGNSTCLTAPVEQPEPEPEPEPENKKDGLSSKALSSRDDSADINSAINAYNSMAQKAGLPLCSKLTGKRRIALRRRLKELGGIEKWLAAMMLVPEKSFLLGKNDRGWLASIDFFLQPNSIPRLLEGMYDNGKHVTNYDDNTVRYVHEHIYKREQHVSEKTRVLNERLARRLDESYENIAWTGCREGFGTVRGSTEGLLSFDDKEKPH